METNALNIEITDENIGSIEDQMVLDNEIASIDCMALNPMIADQVNNCGSGYELLIYRVEVDEEEVFLLFLEDGEAGDAEDFAARASFYATEAEAKAAMGAEYNDWLTRF